VRPRLKSSGSESADRLSAPNRASLDAEAEFVVEQHSRRDVLVQAFTAAGAVGLGGVLVGSLAGAAASAPSRAQDVRILNFLLELEYLQQAFYEEAREADALSGEVLRFAQVVGDHEREHVVSLRRALGGEARPKPAFNFGDAVKSDARFAAAALTLEETATAGYIGQAANLTAKRIPTVARIVPVEARHAAWIRDVVDRLPAPSAFDPAKTSAEVTKTLERTGFVERS
jgi:ferritin-like protein